jgi:isopentenyl diphosphate isomerase/L-lactate dehydrogenase-like FMN-dependent dehydrogenase
MVITCIEDLREIARHKMPRMFFDVSKRNIATQILGKPVSVPLALAPIGLCGMQR